MAEAGLPFAALLVEVRARGGPIGPDDFGRLAKLLSRWSSPRREDLRLALGALFGRDLEGRDRVLQVFDDLYPDEARGAAPRPAAPPAAEQERVSAFPAPGLGARLRGALRGRGLLAAGLGASLVAGVAATVVGGAGGGGGGARADASGGGLAPSPPGDPTGAEAELPPSELGGFETPELCARTGELDRGPLPAAVGTAAGLLALAAAGVLRSRAHRRVELPRAQREAAARLPGPRTYELPADLFARAEARRFSRAAAELREALQPRRRGALDVDATLRATLERGLLPTPVLARPRGIGRVTLASEPSSAAAPFQPRVDALRRSLELQGLEVTPLLVSPDLLRGASRRGARWRPLGWFADRLSDRPLLFAALGEGPGAPRAALAAALAPFPARALLRPTDAPLAPGLAHAPPLLPVLPLSPRGLSAAARALATGARITPRRGPARRLLPSHGRRLAALLALAPRPSFDLGERLRERFLPTAPPDALRACADVVAGGPRSPAALAARAWLQEADPEGALEREARSFFASELARAAPTDPRSAAGLRFRRDLALQALAASDEPARAAARATLVELARAGLADEIAGSLAQKEEQATRARVEAVAPADAPELAFGRALLRRAFLFDVAGAGLVGLGAGVAAWAALGARTIGPPEEGATRWLSGPADVAKALCNYQGFLGATKVGEDLVVLTAGPAAPDGARALGVVRLGPTRALGASLEFHALGSAVLPGNAHGLAAATPDGGALALYVSTASDGGLLFTAPLSAAVPLSAAAWSRVPVQVRAPSASQAAPKGWSPTYFPVAAASGADLVVSAWVPGLGAVELARVRGALGGPLAVLYPGAPGWEEQRGRWTSNAAALSGGLLPGSTQRFLERVLGLATRAGTEAPPLPTTSAEVQPSPLPSPSVPSKVAPPPVTPSAAPSASGPAGPPGPFVPPASTPPVQGPTGLPSVPIFVPSVVLSPCLPACKVPGAVCIKGKCLCSSDACEAACDTEQSGGGKALKACKEACLKPCAKP